MSTQPSGDPQSASSNGAEPVYGTGFSKVRPAPPIDEDSPRYTAPYPPFPSDVPSAPGMAQNIAAALAYVTVFPAIIFLLIEPYRSNRLVRFHSWQSVFYFVVVAALRIVEMLFLATVPSTVAYAIAALVSLILFAGWLVAVIKALQGQKWMLPAVGVYAERTANAGQPV